MQHHTKHVENLTLTIYFIAFCKVFILYPLATHNTDNQICTTTVLTSQAYIPYQLTSVILPQLAS